MGDWGWIRTVMIIQFNECQKNARNHYPLNKINPLECFPASPFATARNNALFERGGHSSHSVCRQWTVFANPFIWEWRVLLMRQRAKGRDFGLWSVTNLWWQIYYNHFEEKYSLNRSKIADHFAIVGPESRYQFNWWSTKRYRPFGIPQLKWPTRE